MKVKVLFFARYREAMGVDSRVEGDFATVDAVRQALVARAGSSQCWPSRT
jgi:molybdopterin synthase sulfur carrier subunit